VTLKGLLPLLRDQPQYARTLSLLRTLGHPALSLDGRPTPALDVQQFARPYAVAALQEDWPGAILVVTGRPERSRDMVDQLRAWSAFPERIHHLASPDSIFYDRPGWDRQTSQARAGVLAMLSASGQHPDLVHGHVIVASVWALMPRTAPPTALRRATRTIRPGTATPLFDLLAALVNAGYEASVVVEEPGTFGHRGSIVDVYPTNATAPLRIDLFGDEVDSIRTFDPATQRSGERVSEAVLSPASEALPEWGKAAAANLAQLDLSECNSRTRQRMAEEIEQIGRGAGIAGMEYYLPYLYPRAATLLDHLPEGSLILLDDLTSLASASFALENQALSLRADMVRDGDLPAQFAVPYFTWPEIERQLSAHPKVNLGYGLDEGEGLLGRLFAPAPAYGGQVQDALGDIESLHQEGQRVVLISRQAERLADLLRGHGMDVAP
jgi:transcription-repair coupling factor (superfamily II helicase)